MYGNAYIVKRWKWRQRGHLYYTFGWFDQFYLVWSSDSRGQWLISRLALEMYRERQKKDKKRNELIKSWMGGQTGCIGGVCHKVLISDYLRCPTIWPSPACWTVSCLRRQSKLSPPIWKPWKNNRNYSMLNQISFKRLPCYQPTLI